MKLQLILHPTDGSDAALKALDLACDLARLNGAKLLILHVQRQLRTATFSEELEFYERIENIRVDEGQFLQKIAQDIVSRSDAAARRAGLSDVDTLLVEGDPTRRITEIAKDREVDAIVMGSRGRGDVAGLLLGSVSHKVTQLAPCTCIVVR
jgi:nucleotide-binding universal stress UspA family protein